MPRETFRQSYLDVVRCPPGISLSLSLSVKSNWKKMTVTTVTARPAYRAEPVRGPLGNAMLASLSVAGLS